MGHEPATEWCEECRTDREDHDPRPDVNEMPFLCILHHQTSPCGVRDAPQAVHHGCGDEEAQILCDCPNNAGHTPAEHIGDKESEATAKLIDNCAAQQRRKYLDHKSKTGKRSDLMICHAKGQHIHGKERRIQVVGDAEHHFGQYSDAGISLEFEKSLKKRMAS